MSFCKKMKNKLQNPEQTLQLGNCHNVDVELMEMLTNFQKWKKLLQEEIKSSKQNQCHQGVLIDIIKTTRINKKKKSEINALTCGAT